MKESREFAAVALWVSAAAFMAFGSMDSAREGHASPFLAWGIFLAIVAVVPTVWCIVRFEAAQREVSVQRVAEIVDALHEARCEVSHLR